MSSYYLVSDSRYPHSEGGAFISNGHTTNSATADQTFSLVVDSSNNLHINSQLGGPNALITSLTIDPAGVVNVPNQLLVAGQPIVGGNAVTKLLAGPNISLNPTSGLGDVTITATGNGTGGFPNPVTTDLDMNSKSISGVYDISCSHIVTAESLYLYNSVANKTLHLSAPNGLLGEPTFTLPISSPDTSGQVLASDISGNFYWTTVSSSGGLPNPANANLDMNYHQVTNVAQLNVTANSGKPIVSFVPPATGGDASYTLPNYPASDNQVLASTTAGIMSWTTAGTGNFSNPSTSNLDMQNNNITAVNNLGLTALTVTGKSPTTGQVLSSKDGSGTLEWVPQQGGTGKSLQTLQISATGNFPATEANNNVSFANIDMTKFTFTLPIKVTVYISNASVTDNASTSATNLYYFLGADATTAYNNSGTNGSYANIGVKNGSLNSTINGGIFSNIYTTSVSNLYLNVTQTGTPLTAGPNIGFKGFVTVESIELIS